MTQQAFEEPTKRVRIGFLTMYGLASASAFLAVMPVLGILIPAQVSQVDVGNAASNLAVVLALGATGAFIGNPIGGALSDRTSSPYGRRRPWILIGSLVTAGGLTVLAFSHSIFWLAFGWFIVQFFGNVLFAAQAAVIPDTIPVHQRGVTQAVLGLTSTGIFLIGTYYLGRIQSFPAGYFPVIGLLLLCNLIFIAFYRETCLPKDLVAKFHLKEFASSFWINPKQHPIFGKAWLAWLLIWTGYALGSGSFLYLYVQHITGYESIFPGQAVKEGISNIQIMQTLWGVPIFMLVSVLSDRLQKRKTIVAGSVLLVACGMIGMVISPDWGVVLAACTIVGVGFRIFFGLGAAFMSEILPSAASRGKDLGVVNIASTIPQIVMPAIGAALINAWGLSSPTGYWVLFSSGAVFLVVGAWLVQTLRGVGVR